MDNAIGGDADMQRKAYNMFHKSCKNQSTRISVRNESVYQFEDALQTLSYASKLLPMVTGLFTHAWL